MGVRPWVASGFFGLGHAFSRRLGRARELSRYHAEWTRQMRYMKLGDSYLVRLDPGEEVMSAIRRFAHDRSIDAGSLMGLGDVDRVVLGLGAGPRPADERGPTPVPDPAGSSLVRTIEAAHEIVSLIGILGVQEGRTEARVHIVVAGRDGTTTGGRLIEARTGTTVELVIKPLPGYVQRVPDPRTGAWGLDL